MRRVVVMTLLWWIIAYNIAYPAECLVVSAEEDAVVPVPCVMYRLNDETGRMEQVFYMKTGYVYLLTIHPEIGKVAIWGNDSRTEDVPGWFCLFDVGASKGKKVALDFDPVDGGRFIRTAGGGWFVACAFMRDASTFKQMVRHFPYLNEPGKWRKWVKQWYWFYPLPGCEKDIEDPSKIKWEDVMIRGYNNERGISTESLPFRVLEDGRVVYQLSPPVGMRLDKKRVERLEKLSGKKYPKKIFLVASSRRWWVIYALNIDRKMYYYALCDRERGKWEDISFGRKQYRVMLFGNWLVMQEVFAQCRIVAAVSTGWHIFRALDGGGQFRWRLPEPAEVLGIWDGKVYYRLDEKIFRERVMLREGKLGGRELVCRGKRVRSVHWMMKLGKK